MILDEATANIDTETEILIQDSLEKMMNIGTVLIVAHRLSTIRNADKIILLSHGEILEEGTHHEARSALHGQYHKLYTLQYTKEQLQKAYRKPPVRRTGGFLYAYTQAAVRLQTAFSAHGGSREFRRSP